MEKELEPIREKLQSDKRAIDKYDEKVDEWKVRWHKNVVYIWNDNPVSINNQFGTCDFPWVGA